MEAILRILEPRLPPALFDLLFSVSSLVNSFSDYLRDWDSNDEAPRDFIGRLLYPEKLLPPLSKLIPLAFSFLAIYITLVSLYRTTTMAIRIGLFIIRWTIVLAVVLTAVSIGMGALSPSTIISVLHRVGLFGDDIRPVGHAARRPSRGERPKVWDTFDAHQEWREGENEQPSEAQKIMKEIYVAGQHVVEDRGGWMKLIFGDGEPPASQTRRQSRARDGRKARVNVR